MGLETLQLVTAILGGLAAGSIGLVLLAWFIRSERPRSLRPFKLSLEELGTWLEQAPVPARVAKGWHDHKMDMRLLQAGLPWTGRALLGARWVALWAGCLLGTSLPILWGTGLLKLILSAGLMLAGLAGPGLWLGARADRRRREIELALPDFLDRLSLGLDAGLSFEVAFRRTASTFRPVLGDELRRVARQIDRGHARSVALDDLQLRNPSPDLRAFVASVNQSDKLGTSLAKTLKIQTRLLRARRRRRAQEASRRLPVLIVFPLVLFFLPALLIIYLSPPILHLFLRR